MSKRQIAYDSENYNRVSDAEIERAKDRLPAVVAAAGVELKRSGGYLSGLCPFHQERSPSFYVWSDHYHCFGCGAHGDAIAFIRKLRNLDFSAAVRELCGAGALGTIRTNAPRPGQSDVKLPDPPHTPASILRRWNSADAPNIARWYLESRGLVLRALPDALRGCRLVWCAEVGQYRPAMVAAITDKSGQITAIQRTWVSDRLEYDGTTSFPKGARAPDLVAGKKCIGPLGSGAVRLAPAGPVLGLSEGVESALAAATLYGLPVWATCGAARLGNVELPEVVERVVVFGDNGPAGEAAAAKAESAYRRRGYSAQVELPSPVYGDFCDQAAGGA